MIEASLEPGVSDKIPCLKRRTKTEQGDDDRKEDGIEG